MQNSVICRTIYAEHIYALWFISPSPHGFPAKKQSSSDFMASVTIHGDFGAHEKEICHYFHLLPFYLPCSNWGRCHDLVSCFFFFCCFFLVFSLKPALSLSSFTLIKRLFSSSSPSAIRVLSSTFLRLLMFLPPFWILAGNYSSSPAFLMMCSEYRLNRQVDSRELSQYSFLNLEPISCSIKRSVSSWSTYRCLMRQVRWFGIPISLRAFHSLSWSTQSKALAKSMKQR